MSDDIMVSFADDGAAHRLEMISSADVMDGVVRFECHDMPLTPTPEALVAAAFLPAMRHGLALDWSGEVACGFIDSVERYQQRVQHWSDKLQAVPLTGGQASNPDVPGRTEGGRVALFFSGGVDSFYSLLENLDEVTDLVFVHGFDIMEGEKAHAEMAERQVRMVGEAYGRRVLAIRTNLRSCWLADVGGWGEIAHGPAMAAVAHLLGPQFGRILIAGSDSSPEPWPWGSHPELDPLWSTARLEFVHDHHHVTRVRKIERVLSSEVARKTLRVCWKNRNVKTNCCRCEKCIRTMITLKAFGRLDEFESFHLPLRLHRVLNARLPLPVSSAIGQLENLKLLSRAKGCWFLKWALRLAFAKCWLLYMLGKGRKSALRRDEITS